MRWLLSPAACTASVSYEERLRKLTSYYAIWCISKCMTGQPKFRQEVGKLHQELFSCTQICVFYWTKNCSHLELPITFHPCTTLIRDNYVSSVFRYQTQWNCVWFGWLSCRYPQGKPEMRRNTRRLNQDQIWRRQCIRHICDRLCGLQVQSSWLQNEDILCFLWGTNWIYICYVEESRLPLWSSGLSSWLQIHRSVFDSRRYQILWEVVGLQRGPPSLLSTVEELLERRVAAPV
jgi:hypothetical protein